jgi:hypothetical protein
MRAASASSRGISAAARSSRQASTTSRSPRAVAPIAARYGDLDGDRVVGGADLVVLLGAWGG